MPIFDGNFEYLEAGDFNRDFMLLPDNLANNEYKEAAATFKTTLERLLSFYELPLQLIYWSAKLSQIKFIGRYQRGIDPSDESRDHELEQQFRAVLEVMTNNSGDALTVSSAGLANMLGDDGRGPGIPPAREGIEAVLAAMVMASYAAFETLAADLWIAAVNRHNSLAANWLSKNSKKELSVEIFQHGFDLTSRMGTVLHTMKKVSFESFYDIKNLYGDTFKCALDPAFEPVDEIVKAEKTRHLFAHRGGLIDRKFKDQMSQFSDYGSCAVGERLRLTGPVTKRHVNACATCGIELLRQVDNWSLAHK